MFRPRAFVIVLTLALLSAVASAQDIPLLPFSYHEGFEGEVPQVGLWAKSGPSTVNFLDATEEQAFEGKRSLKLDVSIEGGTYHYFGVQVPVPCEGKLRLSARMKVGEGNTARVGFGTNMQYPPSHHTGCGPIESWDRPSDEWHLVEADLVALGASGKAGVIERVTANLKGGNVGAQLDRWSIFVNGSAGQRAVVYVDDIRIEGEVPGKEEMAKLLAARYQPALDALQERVAEWRNRAQEAKAAFDAMPQPPEFAEQTVADARAALDKSRELIDAADQRGYLSQDEVAQIEAGISRAHDVPTTVAAMVKAKQAGQPYVVYTPRAISNLRLLPGELAISGGAAGELTCSGCRGEYESLTAVVLPFEDVKGLLVSASDLKGDGGTIPADEVDVSVVKCWYQAGRGIGDLHNKQLVPELLLKDDGLVKVDPEKQANYVRSTDEDGSTDYLLCSDPGSLELADVRPIDAEKLQPVDIAAGSLKQLWFTVHIPEDAQAGMYSGTVIFATGEGKQELPLRVEVYPFDLAPSRLTYSIYYRARLSRDGKPAIDSESRSEEQYRAEMDDLKAHGVLYPTNYQNWDEELLPKVMQIRQQAGLPGGRFYNLGQGTGSSGDPAAIKTLQGSVRKWVDFCAPYGYDEVYFYGIDEATGDRLKAQQSAWKAVQDAGGKTFVACYKQTYETMGALLNTAVLAGRPDPEEAKKYHSVGSEVFCYAYPQVGNEEPETYRRNFGLVLWKAGFDGAMDYAYQHGFGHVWNDFDSPHYRDHNFTYPTVNGVVGTVQWEGFREAVDDVRYVTTLEHVLATAGDTEHGAEARKWLAELEPDGADLYAVRQQVVDYILELTQ